MTEQKINNRRLVRLIDSGMCQAEAARKIGVSRQAVSKRLQELRGKTTKVTACKKVEKIVDRKIDAMEQLGRINTHATWLLDHVMKWIQGDETAIQVLEKNARMVSVGTKEEPEYVTEFKFKDPHEIALKAMAEIRGQIKTQLDIYQALFSMETVQEFQETVLEVIGQAAPEVRSEIIRRLNETRSVRSAVKFN